MGKFGGLGRGLMLLAGISVNASHAAAQPNDDDEAAADVDRFEARPMTIAGQLGIQSPGGVLGIEAEYGLQRWLAIGAGFGPTVMLAGSGLGFQAGGWVAPRWTFTSVALGLDVGASFGPYHQRGFMDEHGPWARYRTAGWFNGAARLQYLHRQGFSFRAFLGVATLLNPGAGNCGDGYSSIECKRLVLGYGGLAFGYAFGRDSD